MRSDGPPGGRSRDVSGRKIPKHRPKNPESSAEKSADPGLLGSLLGLFLLVDSKKVCQGRLGRRGRGREGAKGKTIAPTRVHS